jgi:hypothetical protein
MGVTSNARELQRRFERRAKRLRPEVTRAAQRTVPRAQAMSRQVIGSRIYGVPVPWKRTGALLAGEKTTTRGADLVLKNTTRHALFRFLLGRAGGRKIRTPGVRVVDWRGETAASIQALLLEERHQAVLRTLKG